MQFRFTRTCRIRWFLTLFVVLIILFLLINKWLIYTSSSIAFLEVNACPACFGISLCHVFETNAVELSGWQRFSFFNNDMFNIKNIYYGTLKNQPVIFKKMAHQSEWIKFDGCRQNRSCFQQVETTLTTLLPCSNPTFISKFQNAYITSTGFNISQSKISLETTLQINLEPIVLSTLSDSGLPIPLYYGACGRVAVVSNEGYNLVFYLHSSFQFRAFLARELLISMHELNTGNSDIIIYYPDINLENFVYNQYERRVKIIDLEYVTIVERNLFSNTNLDDDYENSHRKALHSNKYCSIYMPDYNVKQVCRYILLPSIETNERDMSSDFLHSIPETVNHQWNLTNLPNQESQNENSHSTTINIDDNEAAVTDFLYEIDLIRSNIDKIDELIEEVKRIHVEMLEAMANPKLGQELDDKKEQIKKLSYDVSTKLKKMEQAKESRDEHDKTNAQWRIKESQIFVLTRRLRDTMVAYNQETIAHRDRCKKIIVRELEISGNRKTTDELEDILDSDFPGTFNVSILVDTQKAKQSLDAIEARHRDIIKLETCIKELHSMFQDLAMLVANQGEMIDSIEHNVSKAADYVEDAKQNVNIAHIYAKKSAKKKVCIFIILITSILLILIIILIAYFTQRKLIGK
ncbi:unnamed protein product [Rotaria sp. Silwood2]|nr:unnamed protein product [Rotaria sp. Silwood2]CAF3337471.1 unnamed protein product [Rotaria sp. Silwood2]CAF3865218.1 unnamed protein product [Rotaria sp. Silwood2]CAF4520755.1 unnamed protein product [Rotaria sp. Silwood2]